MEVVDLNSSKELNGFILLNHYISSEPLMLILSHLPPKDLLNVSLVCKNWNKIVKDDLVWKTKYQQTYNIKPKRLPWYVYYALFATNLFDKNFIKNGHGQQKYKHWIMKANIGKGFTIENTPFVNPELPIRAEFEGNTGCFTTSYYNCIKFQEIDLSRKLFKKILNEFKPQIYVSEWVYGRFDCGCSYVQTLRIINENGAEVEYSTKTEFQDRSYRWQKIAQAINRNSKYPENINKIIFEHSGRGSVYLTGHYGTKMAGALVKIEFDSL